MKLFPRVYDISFLRVKVLVAAGQLKRKEPGCNEDLLLIRAMRDSNVPKVGPQSGEHLSPLFFANKPLVHTFPCSNVVEYSPL